MNREPDNALVKQDMTSHPGPQADGKDVEVVNSCKSHAIEVVVCTPPSPTFTATEESPTAQRFASFSTNNHFSSNEPFGSKTFARPESYGNDSAPLPFSFAPTNHKNVNYQRQIPRSGVFNTGGPRDSRILHIDTQSTTTPTVLKLTSAVQSPPEFQSVSSNTLKNSLPQLLTEAAESNHNDLPESTNEIEMVSKSINEDDRRSITPQNENANNLDTSENYHNMKCNVQDESEIVTSHMATTTVMSGLTKLGEATQDCEQMQENSGPTVGDTITSLDGTPQTPRLQKLNITTRKLLPGRAEARVTKGKSCVRSGNKSGPSSNPVNVGYTESPTEEDLLCLLYYRNQQREKAVVHELRKQQELEIHNTKLAEHLEHHKSNAMAACAARDEVLQKQQTLEKELASFKEKYGKIKAWAREMTNDYVTLRKGADAFNDTVKDLTKSKTVIHDMINDVQSSTSNVADLAHKYKAEIPQLRLELDQAAESVRRSNEKRTKLLAELKAEKSRSMRYENHIATLESRQQNYDRLRTKENEAVQNAFSNLLQKLDHISRQMQAAVPISEMLKQCLRVVQGINSKSSDSETDIRQVQDVIQSLEKAVSSQLGLLHQSLEQIKSTINTNDKSVDLIQLKEALAKLEPDVTELQNTRIEEARLREKVTGHQTLIEQLQRSLQSSEKHANTFKEGNETILEFVKATRLANSKQRTDLEDAGKQMQLKWATACSELAESREKIRGFEDKERSLLANTENLQKKLDEAQAKETVTADKCQLLERSLETTVCDRLKTANLKLEESTNKITALQKEITAMTEKADTTSKETEHLKVLQARFNNREGLLQSEIKTLKHDNECYRNRQSQLEDELRTATNEAEKISYLQETIKSSAAKMDSLKGVQSRNEHLQQEAATKDLEINSLRNKLEHERSSSADLAKDLKVKIAEHVKERQELINKLLTAEANAALCDELDENLRLERVKVTNLESQISTLHEMQRKLAEASMDNENLSHKLIDFEKAAENAKLAASRAQTLEVANREKDQEIARLKGRVTADLGLSSNLSVAKTEINEYKTEILKQQDRITELEEALKRINPTPPSAQQDSSGASMSQETYEALLHVVENGTQNSNTGTVANNEPARDRMIRARPRKASNRSGTAGIKPQVSRTSRQQQRHLQSSEETSTVTNTTVEINVQGTEDTQENPVFKESHSHPVGSPSIIPNSQFDLFPVSAFLSTISPHDLDRNNTTSPLSGFSSDFGLSEIEGDRSQGEVHEKRPDIQHNRTQNIKKSQSYQKQLKTSIAHRPSSSALSDDLFNQHATSLEAGGMSQPKALSLSKTQSLTSSPCGAVDADECDPDSQSSYDKTFQPGIRRPVLGKTSPRLLRNGSQIGGREVTPFPEARSNPPAIGETTPANRDRYQPNSGAKRIIENDQNIGEDQTGVKRFKRNPSNLEVKTPIHQVKNRSPISKNIPPTLIRKGSVIGTNAPKPGKSQQNTKPARKKSKKTKYEMRFNLED